MASISLSLCSNGSFRRPPVVRGIDLLTSSLSSTLQPFLRELQQVPLRIDVSRGISNVSRRFLDAFVDSAFKFVNQPLIPSQRLVYITKEKNGDFVRSYLPAGHYLGRKHQRSLSNFAPVEEIGLKIRIDADSIEGDMPADFPEGVYIRNGSNPLFGALQSTESVFGRSSDIWVEGEGMLHAVYFTKDLNGEWNICYKNKYVESDTFKLEKERNKPCFLPTIEGDSTAVLVAYLLNQLRFGKVNKYISNTNVFEHYGRLYSTAESHIPQEINISSLETYGNWDVIEAWDRPFTAHPKKAPGSGELVIISADARKPYLVLGIISADGRKLKHKVDLKVSRSIICHDVGVTNMYNIILDMPLTVDINRLIKGGPLIKYDKESYARIGVMPRYGDADSVKWFNVEPCCVFHIFNCFETGDEVVVRGCHALGSIIPGPDYGHNKFEWFSKGFKPRMEQDESINDTSEGLFFSRAYEWSLNMKTGNVRERYLTGSVFSVEFPMINDHFGGQYNKHGYVQVVDSVASSMCALPKYGSLAKLYFEEQVNRTPEIEENSDDHIKVEHHHHGGNNFYSGATFVPKKGGQEEDDGWIISFVHDEDSNTSQVHIIDTKSFKSEPVVKITLPQRVPYGFHAIFIPRETQL